MGETVVALRVVWPKGRSVLVRVAEIPELMGIERVEEGTEDYAPRLTFTATKDDAALNAFLRRVTRTATEPVAVEAYQPEMERLLALLRFEPGTPMPIERRLPDDV